MSHKLHARDGVNPWLELASFIGRALHIVRVRRHITQEELADKLSELLDGEVRQNYVSKIETSRSCPSLKRLGVLCVALDCPPNEIVRIAQCLAENEHRSDKEILAEILFD